MNDLIFLRLLGFVVLVVFAGICSGENVKKSVDGREDTGDTNEENKDESLDIPADSEVNNITCTRRANSQVHAIKTASSPKEYPFMVAVMSHQDEYLCSGSVVSLGMVLTTGQCLQLPISYVMLNTTNDKKDGNSVMLHVTKTEKFPTFLGGPSGKDVGIIYTEKHNNSIASKLRVSNYTNSRNLLDMEAIGFGLNADVGKPKELQSVGLDHRPAYDMGDIMRGYLDCVDTSVLSCFKDTGGPVIFNNELIGIVTKGQEECTKEMTASYEINKVMTEVLPSYVFKAWLEEHITKNEATSRVALASYPGAIPMPAPAESPSRRFSYYMKDGEVEKYTNTAAAAPGYFPNPLLALTVSVSITFLSC